MNPALKNLLVRIGCSCLIVSILLSLLAPLAVVLLAAGALQYAPIAYAWFILAYLGVDSSSEYRLNTNDEAKMRKAGYDPEFVAGSFAARTWVIETFQVDVGVGLPNAIYFGESGAGKNLGSCDGISAAKSNKNLNPYLEEAAARALLALFRLMKLRDKNPIAAAYIYPDYSGYTGHCSAGEMGYGGFIPTTAFKVCFKGLVKSDDKDVKSCDFWSKKVTAHAIAFWLQEIGYSAELSDEEAVANLYGWNQLKTYRQWLVRKGHEIVAEFEEMGLGGIHETFRFSLNNFGSIIFKLARLLGLDWLIPDWIHTRAGGSFGEAQEWLVYPVKIFRSITNYFGWTRWNPAGHKGVDFDCITGEDIIAVADGVVVKPRYPQWWDDPFNSGWGMQVWLDHGVSMWTHYGHLSKRLVEPGDEVTKGQVIGLCGATGRVFGNPGDHLHFGVNIEGPEKMSDWKVGWVNPLNYLGKTIDGPIVD